MELAPSMFNGHNFAFTHENIHNLSNIFQPFIILFDVKSKKIRVILHKQDQLVAHLIYTLEAHLNQLVTYEQEIYHIYYGDITPWGLLFVEDSEELEAIIHLNISIFEDNPWFHGVMS